jgi:hypothetical protein
MAHHIDPIEVTFEQGKLKHKMHIEFVGSLPVVRVSFNKELPEGHKTESIFLMNSLLNMVGSAELQKINNS